MWVSSAVPNDTFDHPEHCLVDQRNCITLLPTNRLNLSGYSVLISGLQLRLPTTIGSMNQREFHSKGKTVAKVINLCKMQVSFSVSPKLCTDFSGFLEVFLSHWLRLHFLHFSLKYCVDNEQKIEIIVSSALHDASAGHFTFYDLTVTFSFFFFLLSVLGPARQLLRPLRRAACSMAKFDNRSFDYKSSALKVCN